MARKRIYETGDDARRVKVYRDSDAGEYIARLYVNGELYAPADYFTDLRADAEETADAMAAPIDDGLAIPCFLKR